CPATAWPSPEPEPEPSAAPAPERKTPAWRRRLGEATVAPLFGLGVLSTPALGLGMWTHFYLAPWATFSIEGRAMFGLLDQRTTTARYRTSVGSAVFAFCMIEGPVAVCPIYDVGLLRAYSDPPQEVHVLHPWLLALGTRFRAEYAPLPRLSLQAFMEVRGNVSAPMVRVNHDLLWQPPLGSLVLGAAATWIIREEPAANAVGRREP
ncbi:MAG TPA: hypothetical protein VL025_04720, partial [Thermoanaerobaculia bacterium]|nr:hypothetical protein [Thermoanaerobaculia bacterium]